MGIQVKSLGCALALVLVALPTAAESVSAKIVDGKGKAVEDAVLLVYPESGGGSTGKPATVDVDQVNKTFVPHVSAVRVGTPIRFPNHDQIRHHVYSFSPAKTFEIPLYKGVPAEAILFDQPGVVTLGCNIHDWMQGYVLVTDAAHFAVSDDDGRVVVEGVPAGAARVRVWHPNLKGKPEDTERTVRIEEGATLEFKIDRKKTWKVRRGGGRGGDRYR